MIKLIQYLLAGVLFVLYLAIPTAALVIAVYASAAFIDNQWPLFVWHYNLPARLICVAIGCAAFKLAKNLCHKWLG